MTAEKPALIDRRYSEFRLLRDLLRGPGGFGPAEQDAFVGFGGLKVPIFVDDLERLAFAALAFGDVSQLAIPGCELQVTGNIIRFVFDGSVELLESSLMLSDLKISDGEVLPGKRDERIDRQKFSVVVDDELVDFPVLRGISGKRSNEHGLHVNVGIDRKRIRSDRPGEVLCGGRKGDRKSTR